MNVSYLYRETSIISLLTNEIDTKPYFDYKHGNIVGLSDNSNETATSAFAFMLSSVFSQYSNLVHVMPTKYRI